MIMSQLSDLLHKIVDVAAGDNARPDLHDEIDALGPEPAPDEAPEAAAAPEPDSSPAPEAAPVDEPVQVQEPVQEQVQEDGSAEADA